MPRSRQPFVVPLVYLAIGKQAFRGILRSRSSVKKLPFERILKTMFSLAFENDVALTLKLDYHLDVFFILVH